MNHPTAAGAHRTPAEPNLRVTFWGVQGSWPVFPTRADLDESARRLATATIERTPLDLADRLEQGPFPPVLLRAMATPEMSALYLQRIGLPDLPTYGGDTTCVEVSTGDGNTLLFDMGTGMREFSREVVKQNKARQDRTIHIFASHEHLDHRNGFPFSSFLLEKKDPFTVHIHGTRQLLMALDDRYGIFSRTVTPAMHVDDPLDYRTIPATFTCTEIRTADGAVHSALPFSAQVRHVGDPIAIGKTTITPFEAYHGLTSCLGYKARHGKSTFVFCTDHELRHGDDPNDPRQIRSAAAERRLAEQCQDADAAYFDGQYFLAEYLGQKAIGVNPAADRTDWGHSCIEDVVARAEQCRVRRAFIGHHDPERPWAERVEIDRQLKERSAGKPYTIELAKSGQTIEL